MRKMIGCIAIVLCLLFRSAGAAWAAPAPTTPDCADQVYRQSHLAECNAKHDPWSRYQGGGGGPRRKGLLGLGGIGGIL